MCRFSSVSGTEAGSCADGNELSPSIKSGKSFSCGRPIIFPRGALTLGFVSCMCIIVQNHVW